MDLNFELILTFFPIISDQVFHQPKKNKNYKSIIFKVYKIDLLFLSDCCVANSYEVLPAVLVQGTGPGGGAGPG